MSASPASPGEGVPLQRHPLPTQPATKGASPHERPIVVGIYGVQGCGKTTLIKYLEQKLGEDDFAFFDGSHAITSVVHGGLDAFKEMDEPTQAHHRGLAIQAIAQQCRDSGRVGVVTGHLTFWSGNNARAVYTQDDLHTYTHILYLDVPAETIAKQRQQDTSRTRSPMDVNTLRMWQESDRSQAEDVCRTHGIMFMTVPHQRLEEKFSHVLALMMDIRDHTEGENMRRALACLDETITPSAKGLEKVLVFDADKTLASVDTSLVFWEDQFHKGQCRNRLKRFFGHPKWQYSYKAFRQVTWLYEEIAETEFNRLCANAAGNVEVHPEFLRLLRQAREQKHVQAIVVTSGVRRIWEGVLESSGHLDDVKVIGGGRIRDGFVVTPDVKAAIVTRLQEHYGVRVYAFGDSEVDIPMLKAADEAFVVSGELETRGKNMDYVLPAAIQDGLHAKQLLIPTCAPPRLDESTLPIAQVDAAFYDNILGRGAKQPSESRFIHATDTAAAKLLMTPMRDANHAGVRLREAHRRAGWWLATQLVSGVIGLEEITIGHVQGHSTRGHRLLGEKNTVIVALMRGGEPMALGVSDAFPSAVFVHADTPGDVKKKHITGQHNLILVDSVVNSGATVVEFIKHIRQIDRSLRIVVVAGVTQANFFDTPPDAVANDINVGLVTLRLSENEFKGKGGTDTGNRLFNTTHLD